jgi:hypothetical protein
MGASQENRRIDLAMRLYVGKIIDYLQSGGDHANARLNMTERSVPPEVQQRVIDGKATRE